MKNSFNTCERQIIEAIDTYKPDRILSFGQKPHSNRLYIETSARRDDTVLHSNWDVSALEVSLKAKQIKYKLSDDAGNYLCNHVFYTGLDFIKQQSLDTKMIFIHVPSTEFVYHATTLMATQHILSSGKLLSAVKVYGKTGEELAYDKRDSLWNDPADFFEYIMFTWGNCMVGDYVVMSDDSNEEQSEKSFNPGIRFYFRYDELIRHPGHAFDGYHPIKVKDEIVLSDYLHACIAPEQYKEQLLPFMPQQLENKVHFIPQDSLGILEWTERVYNFIKGIDKK